MLLSCWGFARQAIQPQLFAWILPNPLHRNFDIHFAGSFATKGSSDRSDISIIAPDGKFDITGVDPTIMRGIIGFPAISGDKDLNPGMAGLDFSGKFVLIEKVAADIACRDAMGAAES